MGEGANTFTVLADATVFCNEGRSPSTLGSATSSSCGASGTVSFVDSISNQNCDADFTITRTWSDNAGNSGNQIITVTDTGVAPTFTNANAAVLDVTVACNACIDADSCVTGLQATDDCSAVVVTFSDSTPTTSCDVASCTQSVSIVRTWNAVDDCGNQAASQGRSSSRTAPRMILFAPRQRRSRLWRRTAASSVMTTTRPLRRSLPVCSSSWPLWLLLFSKLL